MSIVTIDAVKAVMSPGVKDTALQTVIDREEAWLANDPVVGIGPLTGSRIQTLWVTAGDDSPLLLARPTAALAKVVDGAVQLGPGAVVLTGPARIERVNGAWRGPLLAITYTPTDVAAVKRAVIELVQLALTTSGYQQESSEGHQYTRDMGGMRRQREDVARSLDPHQGLMTMRLRHSAESTRVTG